MRRLDGKIALITGGNSGIGLATAKRFVAEGAYVFVTGRRKAELETAVKEIGDNAEGVAGDVSNLADLDRLFARIKEQKGRLDILFANAGIAKYATLGQITEELYDAIFDINVKGLLFTVQKALPLMPDGSSVILNASIVASKGLLSNSVYSATKAAIRSFARTWTTDLKSRSIRVNAISPGNHRYTRTERPARVWRSGRTAQENDLHGNSARKARQTGRDCRGRRVPGKRRRQLHNGNGIIHRRGVRAGLTGPITVNPGSDYGHGAESTNVLKLAKVGVARGLRSETEDAMSNSISTLLLLGVNSIFAFSSL